jgi:hypothetical protein
MTILQFYRSSIYRFGEGVSTDKGEPGVALPMSVWAALNAHSGSGGRGSDCHFVC